MFFCYILQSHTSGRFYVGHAQDVIHRLAEHNNGKVVSTRNKGPWEVVYTEPFSSRSGAADREREIKGWKSRGAIEALIDRG